MAEKNNPKNQNSRPMEDENKRQVIPLVERAERLRNAECFAKGGSTYTNGVCYK